MNSRTTHLVALLLALLLAGAASIYLLLGDGEPIAPSDPSRSSGSTAIDPAASAAASSANLSDENTDSQSAETIRDAADADSGGLVPLPEDADWIDVRIVAAATGEPIANADVHWFDDTVNDAVIARQDLIPVAERRVRRDVEEFASRFGWHTRSDDGGIARIHQTRSSEVVARKGELFGTSEIGSDLVPPADGFRVELDEDREVVVRVLKADGEPAIGVPIIVTVQREGSTRTQLLHYQALAATRAPDGIARLRHVQYWPAALPKDKPYELRVRTDLPGHQDEGIALALDELPTEPIELRLPTTGTMLVRVEMPEASPAPPRIQLRDRGPTSARRASAMRGPDPGGWARFEHVATNAPVRIVAYVDGGQLSADATGPSSAGGTVEVVLRPNANAIRLVGRLLTPAGQPLTDTRFSLRLTGRRNGRFTLTTAADGRFHALIGAPGKDDRNQVDKITAALTKRGQRPLVASVGARELRPGIQNLGDLRLDLPPLIIAGRCTIDGNPAALTARSHVEHEYRKGTRVPSWRRLVDAMHYAGDDGTFAFYGDAPAGPLRLVVRGNHLPIEPIPCDRGQRDLRVDLTRGSALVATILLARNGNLRPIARLVRTDARTAGAEAENEFRANLSTRDDGRFQARWRELLPGTYDLLVGVPGLTTPVIRIPDVQAPPPPEGDPRLVDIDLQSRVRCQVVRLFDYTGNPLPNASRRLRGGLFPLGQPETGELVGAGFTGPESKILLPQAATDVLVAIRGYRPTTVHCTGEPIDVRLDRWPSVQLTLPELPALDGELELAARLLPSSDRRRYRAGWSRGSLHDLVAPPETPVTFAGGVAELPVGDELRRVQVVVQHGRRTMGVAMPEVSVSATTGGMQLPVTAAAVEDAATLLRPR